MEARIESSMKGGARVRALASKVVDLVCRLATSGDSGMLTCGAECRRSAFSRRTCAASLVIRLERAVAVGDCTLGML
jgi:hypothetical protein